MVVLLAAAVITGACNRMSAPADNAGTSAGAPTADALVVEKGRITWVGADSSVKVPDGAQTQDLAGLFVMPGLINLHGHVGNTVDLTQDAKFHTKESAEKDLGTYAAYGVTTVLSMGTDQDSIFSVREAQADGRPTMARIHTVGQGLMLMGGYGGLAGATHGVSTPEEAVAETNRQLDKNVPFIKIWLDSELGTMPKMSPAITQAIIDTAHKRNVRAVAHIFYLEDAKRLANQGIDAFVHIVRDKPIDQALIDVMKTKGIWQAAATLSREASMFAYESTPDFASDPFFTRGVSSTAVETIKSPERQKAQASRPHHEQYPAFYETAKANLKKLADAGVKYGFGTDAGPPGRFPGYAEHWELWAMVEAGFTPLQALTAATGNAAEFLRATDVGRLEPGKWADLLVLDASPLDDIRNSKKIHAVYVGGNEVQPITAK